MIPGAVCDLDPVAANRRLWREIDRYRCDRVSRWISVQLSDEKIVVLHAQRELLHVDVVDAAVGGTEEEE